MNTQKNTTLGNMAWKFAERISAQLVTFVVSIILARLLDPSVYGTIAMINIFIAFANVFVSDGLGSAIIQKKNVDSLDFSSVLILNFTLSIILYTILFLLAPVISAFYGPEFDILIPVLRVLGVKVVLASINSLQHAYIARHMMFRKFFWATLIGTVLSAIVGIWMAYHGFGIWALVAQYLTNSTVDTIILQISINKFPKLRFSFNRVRALLGFGLGSLGSSLLITSYTKVRELIIGKIYSASDLAYYNRAAQFPEIFVTNINTSISAVLFPRLSQLQDDRRKTKELMRSFIKLSTYALTPLLVGLAAVAKPLVLTLLTEKWSPCIFLLQILCLNHVFRPMHTANIQGIRALGRSDIVFKLEFIKKIVEIVSLLIVMRISVEAIAINMLVMSMLFTFVNAYPVRKLLCYSWFEQLKDILPTFIISACMFGVVALIGLVDINLFLKLIIQIIAGIITYVGISLISKNQEFAFIFRLIKTKLRKIN